MFHPVPASKQSAQLYDIYLLLCVQCQTPDDGQRNCPKHAEFYFKNKSEKLMHRVGFIVRIYHHARSSECQNRLVPNILLAKNRQAKETCTVTHRVS